MKKLFQIISIISRILAGLVFTFSGFVKAIDPLGSTYKFVDYFNAFNMPWLEPAALPLSFALSGFEFLIGICLLLFIQNRWANIIALFFMAFFTPLTLWLAFANPVHDCGCFGDAIILTNWQTFYKNIIISALVIISFCNRNSFVSWMKPKNEWLVAAFTAICITSFSWYNYQHLPLLDFRPYKTGTHIPDKMTIPEGAPVNVYEQYFTLLDTLTGKRISIESNLYMNDSTYWGKKTIWKFISASEPKLVKEGYQPPIRDFSIVSLAGEDVTQSVLSDTGYYFVLVAYDLKKSNMGCRSKIDTLFNQVLSDNQKFICLTSTTTDELRQFKTKYNDIACDFYFADPITLKTIIRANPGLVLLHNGTILGKWNSKDIPGYNEIKTKYF
ncbi:MAG: DoxX family protein [Bacteroidales bacterium]|nr:DoxX family protein [Bacteroidales bacterium]